jgi:16S rRNA U516 pseudouridylate synthase RsuA-like enzyme
LLLLTNDTALVHKLAHPSSNIEKSYEVDVDTELSEDEIKLLLDGIWVDEN